jgi:hypothetical protein
VWIKAGLTTERYSVQVIFIWFLVRMNPAYRRVQRHSIFRFCDLDKEILLLLRQVLIIQDCFLSTSPRFENEAESRLRVNVI